MTTIVYRDGIIAYDSRKTMGDLITDDNYNKLKRSGSAVFIFCGSPSDFEGFIKMYEGGDCIKGMDSAAIVFDKGSLYYVGVGDEDGFFINPMDDIPFAIGSGYRHAYTAMDMGATASVAVRMAIKRDILTGGRVRTFKIPGYAKRLTKTD